MADEPFIGSTEACRVLQVDKSTLTRWAAEGRITPKHRLPGRNGALLFAQADVEALRAERATVEAAAS